MPTKDANIDVSILVPVMNEAGNIKPLIDEICAAYKGRRFEIIYIDDGSVDNTRAEIEAEMARVPQLRLLVHARCAGKSVALRTGLLAARGDLIAMLDGDLQNPPSELLKLEKALDSVRPELGLAQGARAKREDTILRRFVSRTAFMFRRGLLGDTHPDTGCGVKVLDRALYLRMPYFRNMHRFFPLLAEHAGGVAVSVPITDRRRLAGQTKYTTLGRLASSIFDVLGIIWLRRLKDPLARFEVTPAKPAASKKPAAQKAPKKRVAAKRPAAKGRTPKIRG